MYLARFFGIFSFSQATQLAIIRRVARAIFCATGLLCITSDVQSKEILSFSIVPQRDVRETFEIWHPILDDLEKRTGLTILLTPCGHFADHLKHLRTGAVDLAYTNPNFAKIAIREAQYSTLARNSEDLQGIIVTHIDSPIQRLQQLRDQSVAFSSPLAYAAYSLPIQLFEADNLRILPRFVENQTSVMLNVALRQVSAGAVASTIFEGADKDVRSQLRILARTRKTASHPILVHKTVSPEQRALIYKALHAMESSSEGIAMLSRIPIKRLRAARNEEYLTLPDVNQSDLDPHLPPP